MPEPSIRQSHQPRKSLPRFLMKSMATGFGFGCTKVAPGTFGTIPGFFIWWALLWPGSPWIFTLAVVAFCFLSVWVSGYVARVDNIKDPSYVVIDECAGYLLTLAPWPFLHWMAFGSWPGFYEILKSENAYVLILTGFLAFRLFDIWKPWIIDKAQYFPGGWGITADDLVAAIPAGLILTLAFIALHSHSLFPS